MATTRPNILFIITDQHRADHVGFGGNGIVRTPNLDDLARRATVFDRCYVANPICMPNRASILTGRMPSAHGCIFNDRSLQLSAMTFPRMLVKAGYRTALIGKSHFQHGMSRAIRVEDDRTPAIIEPWPEGWDTLEDAELYHRGPVDLGSDFYGFQHAELAAGHGDMVAGHHYRWALERGGDPKLLQGLPSAQRESLARYDGWWQIYQPALPEELYSTTFVTERTIAAIESAAGQGDTPWFIQCSFPDPHHPFTPPGRWWNRHDPADMPIPSTFGDPLTDAPAHLQRLRKLGPSDNMVQMFGPDEALVRHAFAAEYGMIEMIDDGVGRVLATLDRLGQREHTIVIFTSDHGEMFGDHGLMLKGVMHYQGCLRVPLLIARPGSEPARTHSLASSVDLAQTVLELAGAPEFDGMQGHSLVPVLDDSTISVRDHVFVEEDFPPAARFRIFPSKVRSLICDEGRITRYSTGEVEVYDLAADPDELVNLAVGERDQARSVRQRDRLTAALMDGSDTARAGAAPAA